MNNFCVNNNGVTSFLATQNGPSFTVYDNNYLINSSGLDPLGVTNSTNQLGLFIQNSKFLTI